MIGLFFGSFNPIHIGHLKIAEYFYFNKNLTEIWYILSPHNPFKKKSELAPVENRLTMLELATQTQPFARISLVELSLPEPQYTYDTLQHFIKKYPNHNFALLLGEDNYHLLNTWYKGDWIIKNFLIYSYPRISSKKNTDTKTISEIPLINISAGQIRERVKQNQPITGLVTEETEKIIYKLKLYQ